MTILSRLLRLCKADLHGVMDQIEDKELLLKQYLREMELSLRQKQDRRSQLEKNRRRIEGELTLRDREAQTLEQELELAIRKQKDDIAKMLIRKIRGNQSYCMEMRQRLRRMKEEEKELVETLDKQQLQYQALKMRVAEFHRRTEERSFEEAIHSAADSEFSPCFTEEEIELELLKRKEALKDGGEK